MKTYLSTKLHLFIISLITLIGLFGTALFFWFTIIFHILDFLNLRKNKFSRENSGEVQSSNMCYAPVCGKILQIRQINNCPFSGNKAIEIKIVIPWWRETGLYLPITGIIKEINFKDNMNDFSNIKHSESLSFESYISLEDQKSRVFGIGFPTAPFKRKAIFKVTPGDRGKRGANIGRLPWRSVLFLYLPEKYEILIQDGNYVTVDNGPLAQL